MRANAPPKRVSGRAFIPGNGNAELTGNARGHRGFCALRAAMRAATILGCSIPAKIQQYPARFASRRNKIPELLLRATDHTYSRARFAILPL